MWEDASVCAPFLAVESPTDRCRSCAVMYERVERRCNRHGQALTTVPRGARWPAVGLSQCQTAAAADSDSAAERCPLFTLSVVFYAQTPLSLFSTSHSPPLSPVFFRRRAERRAR